MFLKKRWSLLLLKHRRQTAKFQFVERNTFNCSPRESGCFYYHKNTIQYSYNQINILGTLENTSLFSKIFLYVKLVSDNFCHLPELLDAKLPSG